MASTIKLSDTIAWASPFLQFRPLSFGASNEPAISNANTIIQTILGPPFTWRWNRAVVTSFSTIIGTADYAKTITNFGFLEKVTLVDGANTFEIPFIRNILSSVGNTGRPESVSAVLDDGAGSITIRFLNAPDKVYTVNITYQKKAPLFTALTQTWAPIPDELSFIYNHGFLAFSAMYADDPRWQIELQRFLASLIGASEGLDETQKNMFLESWLLSSGIVVSSQQKYALGSLSRSSLK